MSAPLSAVELADQLRTLKIGIMQGNKENVMNSTEKVCTEFQKLSLPRESEILDVGGGSGILSVLLQTQGFTNIDVMDEDVLTIQKLKVLRLYRNYINRGVTGLNSSGLRDETYDVIVTSCGISSHCISPTQITELLRILKPDGHLFFTMNYDSSDLSSNSSLFDVNLTSIEKEEKCQVMKKEPYTDSGSIPLGDFYLIRRLPGHLPEYLDNPVPKELEETLTKLLMYEPNPEEMKKFYDSCSENYEDIVLGKYTGHTKCADAFIKLNLDHHVEILDVAAGTGLLGAAIIEKGYVNIDAVDSSMRMLNQAKQQAIYKSYIKATVGKLNSVPVKDETYDVVLMSNGFAPGQICPSSIPELLRVLRPGGYLMWTMKDGYHTIQEFAMMDSFIDDLVRQGCAKLPVGPVVFPNYLLDHQGRFYMMRKNVTNHWATGSPRQSPKLKRKV